MRTLVHWLIKALIGGVFAFIVLNLFCFFWYNVPYRVVPESEITDYAWESGAFHSRLTEGFGYGQIDKNGYNNAPKLAENPTPDVLIIGSSNMEAFQIPQTKTLAYVLDDKLETLDAYSIGISDNHFLNCVKTFERIIQTVCPKYAVIETMSISFSNDIIESAINENSEKIGKFGSLSILTRMPYARLLYFQLQNIPHNDSSNEQPQHASPFWLNALMAKLSSTSSEYNVTPIVFYHPPLAINNDGSVTPQTNDQDLLNFKVACEKNNIIFIDLTETFLTAYETDYILPHGFFNTIMGKGHLNTAGHRLAAEKLAIVISELEGDK